ncbi:hypothetical protein PTKIN_Ptkin17bG0152600 [Pterospermum kingtungense]
MGRRVRGRSTKVKRKSSRNIKARIRKPSCKTENCWTMNVEIRRFGFEGLKNKKKIKFNTEGIKYRRSMFDLLYLVDVGVISWGA